MGDTANQLIWRNLCAKDRAWLWPKQPTQFMVSIPKAFFPEKTLNWSLHFWPYAIRLTHSKIKFIFILDLLA